MVLEAPLQQRHDIVCLRVVGVDLQRLVELLLGDVELALLQITGGKLDIRIHQFLLGALLGFPFGGRGTASDER